MRAWIGQLWIGRLRAFAAQLMTQHRLFCIALGAGAFVRLLVMVGYPGALWFAGDSYVYVGAALRLQPDLSKTTGYSLFLRVLEPLHSFIAVTAVQHLFGLAVGVMVYALARRAGVSERWSVAAALPVLLDGYEIEDEHLVMAEALFTLLITAAALLILWWRRPAWPLVILAGVMVGYAVTVRSEGLPVLVLFPLAVALRDWRRWRQWLAAGLLAASSLAPLAGYAVWFHQHNGSYALTRSDGFYLWGRVSSFAECSVIKPPAYDLAICPAGAPSSRTPPGDFVWHAQNVRDLPGGPVSVASNTLLRDFAIRAVLAQPAGYAESVAHGLWLSVRWPREEYPDPGTVSYYKFKLTPQQLPADHSWIAGGTAYSDAVAYGHATPSRVIVPVATVVVLYQHLVYTYGPLFGLMLILGLGGVLRVRTRELGTVPVAGLSVPLLLPVSVTWCRRGSMLPWVTAVALLVFPIATADFDYRYLLPILPFAGLAVALAFAPARSASDVHSDAKLDKWTTRTSIEPAGSSSSRA
jgi:dolichyl-phosphate-mannose-protein mannosyltransferase